MLEKLKAAYAATTPGEWEYSDDMSAVVVFAEHRFKAVADFGKIDGSAPDANFIALAHNVMPKILKVLEFLETVSGITTEAEDLAQGDSFGGQGSDTETLKYILGAACELYGEITDENQG